MKTKQLLSHRQIGLTILLALHAVIVTTSAETVGAPNILWHQKTTGQNRIWKMNGGALVSTLSLPNNDAPDYSWKQVGTGDFDRDGVQDILWQHPTANQPAIWYMNSNLTLREAKLLPGIADTKEAMHNNMNNS